MAAWIAVLDTILGPLAAEGEVLLVGGVGSLRGGDLSRGGDAGGVATTGGAGAGAGAGTDGAGVSGGWRRSPISCSWAAIWAISFLMMPFWASTSACRAESFALHFES